MKFVIIGAVSAFATSVVPALAQDNSLPESMRIQQSVTQQNANEANTSANGSSRSTTGTQGNVGGQVERNRLDPAAPSPQRLQIDDGASAAVRRNPDANEMHPGSQGSSYNTIVRGAPSTSGAGTGTSTGTSGIGSSGAVGGSASTGSSAGSAGGAGGGSSGGGGN